MHGMAGNSSGSQQYIYWEAQDADNLCGLHCLNSVLQAPVYDIVSLSQIAQKLEAEEAMLTGQYAEVGKPSSRTMLAWMETSMFKLSLEHLMKSQTELADCSA
jgi:Josephin